MLKKLFAISIIATLASTILVTPSQAVTPSTPTKSLVTPAWLTANLKDPNLVLIHVGDNDRSIYARGHIEGAQFIDWKTELANSSESELRNGVVTRANFFRAARNFGISKNSTVVLYSEGRSNLRATWGAWVFNLYGVPDVRILDGGLLAWTASGGATTLAIPAKKPQGSYVATAASKKLRATINDVIANAKSKGKSRAVIVDTRDDASFAGTNTSTGLGNAAAAGHIASAKSIPTASILNSNGTFKSAADIRAAYAAVGVTKDTPVILYCGTGLLASASWFALTQILGNTNVKNYDGSWFEFAAAAPADLIVNPAAKVSS
jgi:thiosulfate/3-mercaptopyruvate sulfurtransferase